MKTFKEIQTEQVKWQQHNFPDRPSWVPIMGMGEEVGELHEAIITHDKDALVDAIGDICIYLTDYASAMNYDVQELWNESQSQRHSWLNSDPVFESLKAVEVSTWLGKLYHAHIKAFQQIRLQEDHPKNAKIAIQRILHYLDDIAYSYHLNVVDITAQVWEKVSQRDWQKNRDTAHLEAEKGGHLEKVVAELHEIENMNEMTDKQLDP